MRNHNSRVANLFIKSPCNTSRSTGIALLLVISFATQVLANPAKDAPKHKNYPSLQGCSSAHPPHPPGLDACKQAKSLLDKHDYKEAIEFLDSVIGYAYLFRIEAYMGLKQYQKVIDDCSKYIELAPEENFGYGTRGLAYQELGQYEKARDDFSLAICRAPLARTYFQRGSVYAKLEQYPEAVEDFSQIILKNSHELSFADEQHPVVLEAKSWLTSSLANAYNSRAEAYENLGKHDLAEQDRQRAKELGYKTE